jgi:hypothetical protein
VVVVLLAQLEQIQFLVLLHLLAAAVVADLRA